MKSRLLPPPNVEDREVDDGSSSPIYERRETDRAEEEFESPAAMAKSATESATAPATETESTPAPVAGPVTPATRPTPQVSARPNGRFAVVGILLVCVVSVSYFLWSTFLRDSAYGVVTGRITALSPPWPGTLTAVYVFAGDTVRQDDVLAIVHDPELQASIDRLGDDLRAAQAELDAQVALITLAARERGNHATEVRVDFYDLRGELLAEQSRYNELSSKLDRRRTLAKRQVVSDEEIESLEFVQLGLSAKIENLQLAVAALETRLESLPAEDHDTSQLKPWLTKIENYQAEIRRLRARQRRGTLRAPMNGTVVEVSSHVGERTTPEQTLLEILPDGSLELVLYVTQKKADAYKIGQQAEVVVEPTSEPIVCQVTHIGQRFEKPLSHVAGRYRPEEKLLPVYLTPSKELPAGTTLRIGSTVRLPTKFFGTSH